MFPLLQFKISHDEYVSPAGFFQNRTGVELDQVHSKFLQKNLEFVVPWVKN